MEARTDYLSSVPFPKYTLEASILHPSVQHTHIYSILEKGV